MWGGAEETKSASQGLLIIGKVSQGLPGGCSARCARYFFVWAARTDVKVGSYTVKWGQSFDQREGGRGVGSLCKPSSRGRMAERTRRTTTCTKTRAAGARRRFVLRCRLTGGSIHSAVAG